MTTKLPGSMIANVLPTAHFAYLENNGTDGDSVGTSYGKTLLTEQDNNIDGMSEASSVITVPIGKYIVIGRASYYNSSGGRIGMRLRDTDNNTTLAKGGNTQNGSSTNVGGGSTMFGYFETVAEIDVEMQVFGTASGGTYGNDLTSSGESNEFASLILLKVG